MRSRHGKGVNTGRPSGLAGDFGPADADGFGVFREGLLVLNEDGANDAGVIGPAQIRDEVWNDVDLLVGVGQGKDGLGNGVEREVFVSAFCVILHGVGEKLQLIDKMRKFWGVDLRELNLPDGKLAQDVVDNTRGDEGRPVIHIFGKLRHGRSVTKGFA